MIIIKIILKFTDLSRASTFYCHLMKLLFGFYIVSVTMPDRQKPCYCSLNFAFFQLCKCSFLNFIELILKLGYLVNQPLFPYDSTMMEVPLSNKLRSGHPWNLFLKLQTITDHLLPLSADQGTSVKSKSSIYNLSTNSLYIFD